MKDENLDYLDKIDQVGEKTTKIISSVGMSIAFTSLVSIIPGIPKNAILPIMTGGTILTSPIIYFGMEKLKTKLDERVKRDMHHASQIALMMQDALETDRKITSMTSLFLNEIMEYLEKEDIKLEEDQEMNINQFLYLINANYFDKIVKKVPSLNREQLVRQILSILMVYFKETSKKTFDEKDAEQILNNCFFIDQELKQEIKTEFKKSKIKFGKKVFYEIIRKDTDSNFDSYMTKRDEEKINKWARFDVNEKDDYETIIEVFADEESIKELGNAHELDWDMELLVRMMQLITTSYRQELLEEKEDYSNFQLVASFIYSLMCYALVNNKREVSYKEMINSFKGWPYLSFDMKLRVLDDIFTQEKIDYQEHPFKLKKPKKSPQKIIQFQKPTENKN